MRLKGIGHFDEAAHMGSHPGDAKYRTCLIYESQVYLRVCVHLG